MNPAVLVVEPHADLRSAIVATLSGAAWECVAVSSPDDAMLMLREQDYAYILLDTDSPQPLVEFRRLVSADPELMRRVVAMADEEDETPWQNVLRKPFDRRALLTQIHS